MRKHILWAKQAKRNEAPFAVSALCKKVARFSRGKNSPLRSSNMLDVFWLFLLFSSQQPATSRGFCRPNAVRRVAARFRVLAKRPPVSGGDGSDGRTSRGRRSSVDRPDGESPRRRGAETSAAAAVVVVAVVVGGWQRRKKYFRRCTITFATRCRCRCRRGAIVCMLSERAKSSPTAAHNERTNCFDNENENFRAAKMFLCAKL